MKKKLKIILTATRTLFLVGIICLAIIAVYSVNISKPASINDDLSPVYTYLPQDEVNVNSNDSVNTLPPTSDNTKDFKQTVNDNSQLQSIDAGKVSESTEIPTNVSPNVVLRNISLTEYISNLNTYSYSVTKGETCSTILKEYENTCNYNTALKYIKLLNPSLKVDNLEIGTIIRIPKDTFISGRLYKISSGDTWSKIAKLSYPEYDISAIDFLMQINNLPNKDCPLGENIFIPQL